MLGGYGFSRYRIPGRNTLLWSVLLTKLFPRVVVIVPFFVTLRNLQLMNTYQGLILVYLMVTFPVAIWLLKGFFDKIPLEIEEAAIVDGCSLPQLLWQVVLADGAAGASRGGHVLLHPRLERVPVRAGVHQRPGAPAALGRARLLHRRERHPLGRADGRLDRS